MKLILKSATLSDMIAQTYSAMCTDKYRPVLNGILFLSENETLRLVATDTHRLAIAERQATGDSFRFILSAQDVRNLKKILRRTGNCLIEFTEELVCFTTPTGSVYAVPVNGQFPNYSRIIPADGALEILCEKERLLEAFSVLMKQKPHANRCTVNMEDGCLLAFDDYQTMTSDCETAWLHNADGLTDFDFAVDGKYMIDAAKSVPGDMLRLRFQGGNRANLKPILIDSGSDTANLHLLMPMQIHN